MCQILTPECQTPKPNRPSFCLILKLSHALMVCSVCYLGCMIIIYMRFLLNEGSLNVTTFRYCCLGFFLKWNTLFIFRYMTTTFHVLVNTYFLNFRLALLVVLRALVHLISVVIFNNFSVFNFPFFNFEQ